jgi:hypothetical protein
VSQIGHVRLDGGGEITLPQANAVFGMETVNATRQIYWIDNGAASIKRANADFSGVTTIVTGLGGGNHLNLALAPAANLIFWSNADGGSISRANLSGGPIIGTFASPGAFPDDLAVDTANQRLYWETQSGEVVRSSYDGSGQVTLMNLGASLGSGGSGLYLDLVAHKMYLSVPNQRSILRANLDGTGLETVLSTSERPFGMELSDGRMYWTDLDGGRLRSANIDGSDVTTILSDLDYPRQISIMAVPEPTTTAVLLFGAVVVFVWTKVGRPNHSDFLKQ